MLRTEQLIISLILPKINDFDGPTYNYEGLPNVTLVIFIKKISYASRFIRGSRLL